jgi:hypothetical protein
VAALAFALFWALWENHRANTESEREARAFNEAIVDLIDRSLEALSELEANQLKFPGNADPYWRWNHTRALTRKALDYLRQAGPPEATLTLTLTELDELFEQRLGQPEWLPNGMPPMIGTVDAASFQNLRDKLTAVRTKVRSVKA